MVHSGDGATGHFSFPFPSSAEIHRSRSPSSPSVDCTLSLGTPSTRHTSMDAGGAAGSQMVGSYFQVFGSCDALSHTVRPYGSIFGSDPVLLARRCANCDTTSTPLWRNGPRGPKSLCNACGIRYKKEERRAAATTTNTLHAVALQPQHAWNCYSAPESSTPVISDVDGEVPYLSWRLNGVPSPSHFTTASLLRYQ